MVLVILDAWVLPNWIFSKQMACETLYDLNYQCPSPWTVVEGRVDLQADKALDATPQKSQRSLEAMEL